MYEVRELLPVRSGVVVDDAINGHSHKAGT